MYVSGLGLLNDRGFVRELAARVQGIGNCKAHPKVPPKFRKAGRASAGLGCRVAVLSAIVTRLLTLTTEFVTDTCTVRLAGRATTARESVPLVIANACTKNGDI